MKSIPGFIIAISFFSLYSCLSKNEFPVSHFYDYDRRLPLEDSVSLVADSAGFKMYYVSYTSVHNKKVTGLLSIPGEADDPAPVVILVHGLGDKKTADYIEYGHQYLVKNKYAVLRIDLAQHGDRMEQKYKFNLTNDYAYWSRDIAIQSVFDLRRTVDFIETRKELDAERIGFYGISLGGIIGTVFCSVDKRVKVPVIALAGANINLILGMDALTEESKIFFSMIDPVNFVEEISPRPLLMINSENDEVIPPITSRMMYNKAKDPKAIKWYPAKHRDIPADKVYADGVEWYDKYLR